MSFPLVCLSCGAPSGPSTGICPFCKAVVRPAGDAAESAGMTEAKRAHAEGNLPRALSLCALLESEDPKSLENPEFLFFYAKVLLEAEGPSSKIRSLLGRALVRDGENAPVAEYLELMEARALFTREKGDAGEEKIAAILRRSPKNSHALFILGAHLFWSDGDAAGAIRNLERCVSIQPKFLRAWGCLGAIYEKLGNPTLAANAFRICAGLETEPTMKSFFGRRVSELSG